MPFFSLADYEAEAQRRLDPRIFDFFSGGADDEVTLRENPAAYSRLKILPRVLRGRGSVSVTTSLLGQDIALPVLVAPTAFHRMAHPDGELATAKAAAAAETIFIVSMGSTTPIEKIVSAVGEETGKRLRFWFQLYLQSDLFFLEALIRRVEAAGCEALVITVDSPVFGNRLRDRKNNFVELPDGLCCENLRSIEKDGRYGEARRIAFSSDFGWEQIEWLKQTTDLPLILKGVMHSEDAILAKQHGAAAVVISNHGGRQLDEVPATLDVLPDVVTALGGEIPILIDGGIRRGTDVLKALALGATAVAVGRPILWGLAANGQAGVQDILEILRSELERALALCGCSSPNELNPGFVRYRKRDSQ